MNKYIFKDLYGYTHTIHVYVYKYTYIHLSAYTVYVLILLKVSSDLASTAMCIEIFYKTE